MSKVKTRSTEQTTYEIRELRLEVRDLRRSLNKQSTFIARMFIIAQLAIAGYFLVMLGHI